MIPSETAHVRYAADTHPGLLGKNNEDQYAVGAYLLSPEDDTPSFFSIVADGIGGHKAGEVASAIAVERITRAVAESDASQPTAIMQAAIIQASQVILAQAEKDDDKHDMGTTCACVWLIGSNLYIASVGNSRIYLIRDKRMLQINIDHTWVQEAVDAGVLKKEQARNHPNANIIRRHLGSRKPVNVDLRLRMDPKDSDNQALRNQGIRLQPGDKLILCSDGLSDMVEDADILEIINTYETEHVVQNLIERANANGGKDNITVVAIEVPAENDDKVETKRLKRFFGMSISCLIVSLFAALFLLVGGYLGWNYFVRTNPTATPTQHVEATSFPTLTTSPLEPSPIPITPTQERPGGTMTPPDATLTPWPTDTPPPSEEES